MAHCQFQFLNGAIKRNAYFAFAYLTEGFQFLNGAIKSDDFDETKPTSLQFQFLNGAIKSFCCRFFVSTSKSISIPKWCD